MKVICPIGFDLADGPNRTVKVGPGTKLSCDKAIRIANRLRGDRVIMVTAGVAGPTWSYARMCDVMADYIRCASRTVKVCAHCADMFNTFGEMEMLARSVSAMDGVEIILVVKNWHAPRAKFLLSFWLRKYGCHYPVSVRTYPQPVPIKILAQEYVMSWPLNLLRVARFMFS